MRACVVMLILPKSVIESPNVGVVVEACKVSRVPSFLLASPCTSCSAAVGEITVPRAMNAERNRRVNVSARAEGTMNNFQVADEHRFVS